MIRDVLPPTADHYQVRVFFNQIKHQSEVFSRKYNVSRVLVHAGYWECDESKDYESYISMATCFRPHLCGKMAFGDFDNLVRAEKLPFSYVNIEMKRRFAYYIEDSGGMIRVNRKMWLAAKKRDRKTVMRDLSVTTQLQSFSEMFCVDDKGD